MINFAASGYSYDDVRNELHYKHGSRDMRYEYALLDNENSFLYNLANVREGNVTYNSLADIKAVLRMTIREGLLNLPTFPILAKSYNPVLWARLTETTGTNAADSSGNGINGTYGAAVTLGKPSLNVLTSDQSDTSVETPGTALGSGVITFPHNSRFNAARFTIAFFLKTTDTSGTIIQRYDAGANNAWYAVVNADKTMTFRLYFTGGAFQDFTPTAKIANGFNNFIRVSYDGALLRIYANHALILKAAETRTPATVTQGLQMGFSLVANYDELFFFDYCLSKAQGRNLYKTAINDYSEINYGLDRVQPFAMLRMSNALEYVCNEQADFNAGTKTNTVADSAAFLRLAGGVFSGTWISPPIRLGKGKFLGENILSWRTNNVAGTSIAIQTSIDGMATWQTPTSGGGIPGLVFGQALNRKVLYIRATLTTNNLSITPKLTEVHLKLKEGFAKFPCGLYLFTTYPRQGSRSVVNRTVECFDQLVILRDASTETRYTVTAGTNYIDAVKTILLAQGFAPDFLNLQPTTSVLPADRDWLMGTKWLSIINDLLASITYRSLWFDPYGIAVAAAWVSPQIRQPDYVYTDDMLNIVLPEITQEPDVWDKINSLTCVVGSPDQPTLFATRTNDNLESILSTHNRGRKISDIETIDGPDQPAVDSTTDRRLTERSQAYEIVGMETPYMPHWDSELLTLQNTRMGIRANYTETQFTGNLKRGAKWSHRLRRII